MERKYDPKSYWEARLADRLDVTTVGQSGLGYVYNSWLYRARFRAMRRALRKLDLSLADKSLVALGIGSGAWIPFWQGCGIASIVGVDVSTSSPRILGERYPQYRFCQADVCAGPPLGENERFDIATAFDVLFHITDDVDFANAISNVSRLVSPGGLVLFSDSFSDEAYGPFFHEYHRTYDHYMKEFERVGLEPVRLEPIYFTMTTPVGKSRSGYGAVLSALTRRTLRLVSKLAARRQTEWANHVIGCSLFCLDDVLCRMAKTGPSLKILFTRKQ